MPADPGVGELLAGAARPRPRCVREHAPPTRRRAVALAEHEEVRGGNMSPVGRRPRPRRGNRSALPVIDGDDSRTLVTIRAVARVETVFRRGPHRRNGNCWQASWRSRIGRLSRALLHEVWPTVVELELDDTSQARSVAKAVRSTVSACGDVADRKMPRRSPWRCIHSVPFSPSGAWQPLQNA